MHTTYDQKTLLGLPGTLHAPGINMKDDVRMTIPRRKKNNVGIKTQIFIKILT